MIRYSLVCGEDHAFEAWFRDSLGFDEQNRDNQVVCPRCGSSAIRKALMAPAIQRRGRRTDPATLMSDAKEPVAPVPASPDAPPAVEDEKSRNVRAFVRELHAKVKAHAEDVGSAFPVQARRMHEGEEPKRSIYGTATGEEVRSLVEDGVEILPLPSLPDSRN